tara:strand:+ start:2778 stop:3101 length:324 start_codon:yes stop_codon:yes gene_type:complete
METTTIKLKLIDDPNIFPLDKENRIPYSNLDEWYRTQPGWYENRNFPLNAIINDKDGVYQLWDGKYESVDDELHDLFNIIQMVRTGEVVNATYSIEHVAIPSKAEVA